MSGKGFFVALDGIDGSGNSTHSKLLADWVSKYLGLRVLLTKEPTDGPVGRLMRHYLRMPSAPIATDALLFAADRVEHVEKVIRPALANGVVVVTDRYLESSIAYQAAQGLPVEWIISINKHALRPSLNIILDIEPESSLPRKQRLVEKFEVTIFLKKVREMFLTRARTENYPIVNTKESIDQTQARIRNLVRPFLTDKSQR